MHPSALKTAALFFTTYTGRLACAAVIDLGARDVTGSLKSVCPGRFKYTGVDLTAGKGVDVVMDDPYRLPFADESADIITCSSVFEHTEMFWLLFLEVLRVLKPSGLFYLNVPSNGVFHRYSVDCWRFYPDSGVALVNWGRRHGYKPILLEAFTGKQDEDIWNDFVSIYLKDEIYLSFYPARIIGCGVEFSNGIVDGHDIFIQPDDFPEDMAKLYSISQLAGRTGMDDAEKLRVIREIIGPSLERVKGVTLPGITRGIKRT